MPNALSIGQLARQTAVAVETVRYYEKIGLLAEPSRTAGNYRSYGSDALQRLSFIRRARDLGFSLEQIRTLLNLADDRQRSCGEVDAIAQAQLETIKSKIADLQTLQQHLDSLIRQCKKGTVADCRILDSLGPQNASA
jgi:Cu(I)-responsive transcriptional regulator